VTKRLWVFLRLLKTLQGRRPVYLYKYKPLNKGFLLQTLLRSGLLQTRPRDLAWGQNKVAN
tara:strand:+ start:128 stop:310 length:183 start_codon:yes stop_codon:yes gene_type:complete